MRRLQRFLELPEVDAARGDATDGGEHGGEAGRGPAASTVRAGRRRVEAKDSGGDRPRWRRGRGPSNTQASGARAANRPPAARIRPRRGRGARDAAAAAAPCSRTCACATCGAAGS